MTRARHFCSKIIEIVSMKGLLIILLPVILAVVGCDAAATNPNSSASPNRSESTPISAPEVAIAASVSPSTTDYPSPPGISISAGGRSIDYARGSYCWRTSDRIICADSITPDDLLESRDVVPTTVESGAEVEFEFDFPPKPDSIGVTEWARFRSNEVPLNPGGTFTVSHERGLHGYLIFARWEQGDASYVFRVKVE